MRQPRLILLLFFIGVLFFNVRAQDCLPADNPPGPYMCWPLVSGFNGNTHGYTPGYVPYGFCGEVENNSWFSFAPCNSAVSFRLTSFNCTKGYGLEAAIYNNNLVQVSNCYSSEGIEGGGIVTADDLVPGEIYYFMIDGFWGDVCEYYLTAIEGLAPSASSSNAISHPGTILGPTDVCTGEISTYKFIPPWCEFTDGDVCPLPNLSAYYDTIYQWHIPPGAEIRGNSNSETVNIKWGPASPGGIIMVNMEIISLYESCNSTFCASGVGTSGCHPFTAPISINVHRPVVTYLPPINKCKEECITLLGQTICENGSYEFHFLTAEGCDSTVNAVVLNYPQKEGFMQRELCHGECFNIGQQSFCQSGHYEVKLPAANGCDSLVNLELSFMPAIETNLPKIGLCEDECFEIDGRRFCNPGSFAVSFSSESGCDSIVQFEIEKLRTATTYLPPVKICEGECYNFQGQSLCQKGQYFFSLNSSQGCDSNVVVQLDFYKKDTTLIPVQKICKGDCLEIGNNTICAEGEYNLMMTNKDGCDSLIVVDVEVVDLSVEVELPDFLTPDVPHVALNASFSRVNSNTLVKWDGPGINRNNQFDNRPLVDAEGEYTVHLIDTLTGCQVSQSKEVYRLNYSCSASADIEPASKCFEAPFICGKYLQGYCSSLSDSDPYTPGNLKQVITSDIENNHWIEWTPCSDSVIFRFATYGCSTSKGIELSVLKTNECNEFTPLVNSKVVDNKVVNEVLLKDLEPGELYLLMLDGVDGDLCNFQIEIITGVSTSELEWGQAQTGFITGDAELCPEEVLTYTVTPPRDKIISVDMCKFPDVNFTPAGSVKWQKPEGAVFIGDSTELSVSIYFPAGRLNNSAPPFPPSGILTSGDLSVKWEPAYQLPDNFHCDIHEANTAIETMPIRVEHEVETLSPINLCEGDNYNFCGQYFSRDTLVACMEGCKTLVQEIRVTKPESYDYDTITICQGDCFQLPVTKVNVCEPGTYTVPIPKKCGGEEKVTIKYHEPVDIRTGSVTEICDPRNSEYHVSFDIIDGTPPYQVNNQPIAGSRFVSHSIPNNHPYEFLITDSDRCVSRKVLSGSYNCGPLCLSIAGTMGQLLLSVCDYEPARAFHHNDESLDSDDTYEYILHTGQNDELGDIIDKNRSGEFTFDEAEMEPGQVYYISFVVGTNINGHVDLEDPCLSVSKGQPVIFNRTPETFTIDSEVLLTCNNPKVELWGQCYDPATRLRWLLPDGSVAAISSFTTDAPGLYIFEAVSSNGCSARTRIHVMEDMTEPVAEAGIQQKLYCDKKQIRLDGRGSSIGRKYKYHWTTRDGNFVSDQDQLSPLVNMPGIYYLVVTDIENGCSGTDSVTVVRNENLPQEVVFNLTMPSCSGYNDGSVEVLEVIGGTPPYNFSFDDAGYSARHKFTSLKSGTYHLHIMDASGCRLSKEISLREPPVLDVDLGDDITIMAGDKISLTAASTVNPDRIFWWNNLGDSCTNRQTWELIAKEDIACYVKIEDIYGCDAEDEVNIFVKKASVYVPNAFSPNDDGRNDYFTVYGGNDVKRILSLKVFDRDGQVVYFRDNFKPNDEEGGWNGLTKGELMKQDTYLYISEVEFTNGTTETFKGDFTLVR